MATRSAFHSFQFQTNRPVIGFLATLGLLMIASNGWGLTEPTEPIITVSAEAEVKAIPDEAIITAGILSRAATVGAASEENDAKVKALREFLKKQGIEDKFISTTYMQISPIDPPTQGQSYSKKGIQQQQVALPPTNNADPFDAPSNDHPNDLTVPQPIGYQVSRTFRIVVSDLARFEAVYKGIIGQGVNTVHNVEFRTSQFGKFRDQARLLAVRAAREKALAMAAELGAKLAAVRTIQENGNSGTRYGGLPYRASSDPFGSDDSASEVTAGQISITASVQVVFVLKDAEL